MVVRWALGESGGAGAPGDSAIRAALQGFGEVVSVRAVPKRGLAFVTLASGAAASAALSAGGSWIAVRRRNAAGHALVSLRLWEDEAEFGCL